MTDEAVANADVDSEVDTVGDGDTVALPVITSRTPLEDAVGMPVLGGTTAGDLAITPDGVTEIDALTDTEVEPVPDSDGDGDTVALTTPRPIEDPIGLGVTTIGDLAIMLDGVDETDSLAEVDVWDVALSE